MNPPIVIITDGEDCMVAYENGAYIGHDDQVDFEELCVKYGIARMAIRSTDEVCGFNWGVPLPEGI